jgi:hypothetical protein
MENGIIVFLLSYIAMTLTAIAHYISKQPKKD